MAGRIAPNPAGAAPASALQMPVPRRQVLMVPPLLGLAAAVEATGPAPARAEAAALAASPLPQQSLQQPAAAATRAAAGAGADLEVAAPPRPGSLAARIATQGSIQQPGGLMPPWAPKQIYYPRWMFGEWEMEMIFTGLRLPLGRDYVPDGFLQEAEAPAEQGGLGSRYSFRQRWYSTLPPTLDNQLRVNLGLGMPRDAIIADRAFNTRQATNAFLGWEAVEEVEYDPRDAPLRETVTLSRLSPDMALLPPRRLELYINRLSSEAARDGQEGAAEGADYYGAEKESDTFYTSELCRQVLLGVRQVEVKDYEVMHSWHQLAPNLVQGRQRSCLYLQPQERLYFSAAGRAVAVYDYDVTMRRVAPEADAPPGAVACVPTPKDVVQCV